MNVVSSAFRKIITLNVAYQNKIKKEYDVAGQNIEKHMSQKLTILQSMIKYFHENFNSFVEVAKNSSFTYTALLARSCLIAKKSISPDLSYPVIKKLILRENYKLTPLSCTALFETLNYFKFDGDQQRILDKLCSYYQHNYSLFTFNQESVFWANYITIMNNKVHSNLDFINLNRKNNQIFELCALKQVIQKYQKYMSINNKIVKQFNTFQNEINLKLNKPGKQHIQILIRIKQIDDVSLIQSKLQRDLRLNRMRSKVLGQINQVNSLMKKGWNVILHGKAANRFQNKQKYKWAYSKPSTLRQNQMQHSQQKQKEGYWKSERIPNVDITSQQFLAQYQNRQKLYKNSRYSEGIFYDSDKTQNRNVDMIITLLLSASSKYSNNIKYYRQNKREGKQNKLINYISLPQLRECYGYAKSCQFHNSLLDNYVKVQAMLKHLSIKQKKQKYNLDFYEQLVQQQFVTQQDIKGILIEDAESMSQLVLNASKLISDVHFNNQYNKQQLRVNERLGNYAGELFWQMRPYFDDTLRIMDTVDEMINKFDKDKDKNVKVAILSRRQNIPYILQTIVEGKYWTVPQFRKTPIQSNQAKQNLMNQLIQKINKQ